MNSRFLKYEISILPKVLLIICLIIQLYCSMEVRSSSPDPVPDHANIHDGIMIENSEELDDASISQEAESYEEAVRKYFDSLPGLTYVYLPNYQLRGSRTNESPQITSRADSLLEEQHSTGDSNSDIESPDAITLSSSHQNSPNDVTANLFAVQGVKAVYKTAPIEMENHDLPGSGCICIKFGNERRYISCTNTISVPTDTSYESSLFHKLYKVWGSLVKTRPSEFDIRSIVRDEAGKGLSDNEITQRLKSAITQVVTFLYSTGYEAAVLNKSLEAINLDNLRIKISECNIHDKFIRRSITNKSYKNFKKEFEKRKVAEEQSTWCAVKKLDKANTIQEQRLRMKAEVNKQAAEELDAMERIKRASDCFY